MATLLHRTASETDRHDGLTATLAVSEVEAGVCTATSPAVSGIAGGGSGLVEDCATLLGLRKELAGSGGALDWSANAPITGWEGVRVTGGRVTGIAIDGAARASKLAGTLPDALADLDRLEILRLPDHALKGKVATDGALVSMPAELADLARLRTLVLTGNRLFGCIPVGLGRFASTVAAQEGGSTLEVCAAGDRVVLSRKALTVVEGETETLTVVLSSAPNKDVTVTIARKGGGDSDITVTPASLTFNPVFGHWSKPQTVTFSAATDTDSDSGQAVFALTVTSAGADYDGKSAGPITVIEKDRNAPAPATLVTLSQSAVTATEGGSASWTVALEAAPTAPVTIAIASGTGDDADLTVNPASLTFDPEFWGRPQTVTVSAAEDADTSDGEADFAHTATSGDGNYDGTAIGSVTVTEGDNDARLAVAPTELTVEEGSSATWTVSLKTTPSAPVTVKIARDQGGDADLGIAPAALTFTTANWNAARTVTVSAAADADGADGEAVFVHSLASADTGYAAAPDLRVTVREDDDRQAGVTVTAASDPLPVAEGGDPASWTLALATPPVAPVTIHVASRPGDDPDLTVAPAVLTFTAADWNAAQTVSVSAAADPDAADGEAVFLHTALSAGADYAGIAIDPVTVVETDTDEVGVAVTDSPLAVPEGASADFTLALATRPLAAVTVAIARADGGDTDLTVSPAALTFTTATWKTAQTVTASAAADDDAKNGEAEFTLTLTGDDPNPRYTGYAGLAVDPLVASEVDRDAGSATFTPATLDMAEGGRATYTVVLDKAPSAAVTVRVTAGEDSDTDLGASPAALTFTTGNWNTAQTVTVASALDDDIADDEAVFHHHAESDDVGFDEVDLGQVTITASDRDEAGIVVSTANLGVPEGDTATYNIVLQSRPSAPVTITTSSSDPRFTVSPAALTFAPLRWDIAQDVTVAAADDQTQNIVSGTVSHAATSGDEQYHGAAVADVALKMADNDANRRPPGVDRACRERRRRRGQPQLGRSAESRHRRLPGGLDRHG